MKITYDKSIDAAKIYLIDIQPGGVKKTYTCDPLEVGEINLDFDINDFLIGIEVQDASKKLPPEILEKAVLI
jgi:uncharacterized protein YuzE